MLHHMTIEAVQQLPRSEKLKLMEALWEDLSRPAGEFQSPTWHAEELAATEQRLAEGQERILDWEPAKQELRDRCQ
jgi:hypothetical protein